MKYPDVSELALTCFLFVPVAFNHLPDALTFKDFVGYCSGNFEIQP